MTDRIKKLAIEYFKSSNQEIRLLKGDGSDRKIYRITPGDVSQKTLVGVEHLDLEENRNFLLITQAMREIGLPAPEVHLVDQSECAYLIEDLGEYTLAEKIQQWSAENKTSLILKAYCSVLDLLPKIQTELPKRLMMHLKHYPMDKKAYESDIDYFKQNFVKMFEMEEVFCAEQDREIEESLLVPLSDLESDCFVYRDFQSRNIVWRGGAPYLIDYQSAMLGPRYYDPASLLFASKSGLSQEMADELIRYYYDSSKISLDYDEYQRRFYSFVLLRRLRSLGSYGYLSQIKAKSGFYNAIEPTLEQLIRFTDLPFFGGAFEKLNKFANEALSVWRKRV